MYMYIYIISKALRETADLDGEVRASEEGP